MVTSGIINNDVVSGIDPTSLENLVLELNNDVDNISSLLHEIDMIVYDTNDYFRGSVAESIREKYGKYKGKSEIIISNLTSYADDLLAIKNSLENNDNKMSTAYDSFGKEIKVSN